jgi:hypothetical protein
MSSPRVTKIHQLLEEGLRNLGQPKAKLVTHGTANGVNQAVILNLSKSVGAWASADLKAIIVAIPAGSDMPDSVKTQSHAAGQFIDGSVSFQVWMESVPSSAVPTAGEKAFISFQQDVLHVLRGQLGAPIALYLTAAGTEPKVIGLEGAVANAGAAVASLSPYGRSYAGGI